MNILVTGSGGFIGRNLVAWLKRRDNVTVIPFDLGNTPAELDAGLAKADWVFHLAGVNRPTSESEFQSGNTDFTKKICNRLLKVGRAVPMLMTSSIQAALDNPYGISKRQAEQAVKAYSRQSGAPVMIYCLKNVFGKWCHPNYNSVVATFCYNTAHDLPIAISDLDRELELVYIDDVVYSITRYLDTAVLKTITNLEVEPSYKITLGHLADRIQSFREMRKTLQVPNFADDFTRKLYATFLSYLEPKDFAYTLEQRCDERGCLAEFVKSSPFGQVFISRTHPGITRGNHYHHTKTEKFLVLEGKAVIRFRSILDDEVIEYRITGEDFRVLDIPPGYTHSIENVGKTELVTLFWASEIFNPTQSDTNDLVVL